MPASFKVACIQNCADDDVQNNLAFVIKLSREAAAAGAGLICLPENFACLEETDDRYASRGYDAASHPALLEFVALGRELGVFFALGSLTIKISHTQVANRSFLISPDGLVLADYDKIHLFDVRLRSGECYRESNVVVAGDCARVVDLPWGRLGLSICYDVRFPHLYRMLAKAGADFVAIPAAFTHTTGLAHWHVLVRARAIETSCFVFAAAQCGVRRWGRRTFGHSLIVNPWGEVLADGGTEPGFVLADIETARVAEARTMIPALDHDRTFSSPA